MWYDNGVKWVFGRENYVIKNNGLQKRDLTTVKETATLEEALAILEESGYRCVPILDESGKIFRGNIYKMHIYRHKANGGDMTASHLSTKNATKFIYVNSSFFNVFFTIKELPYIAVLDENNQFYGILTHSSLLNMLYSHGVLSKGSYVDDRINWSTRRLSSHRKIIAKYSSIASCITLDIGKDEFIRRTMITLPANTSKEL